MDEAGLPLVLPASEGKEIGKEGRKEKTKCQ